MSQMDREFDVIVFGATGFTGYLTAEYLLNQYGLGDNLRWAIAGRSPEKLDNTRAQLQTDTGVDTTSLSTLVADASDLELMRDLASRTHVVCTTVGPYALYGSQLVEACALTGTHYCDLTGEVHWIRRMIDQHHETAASNNARIVFTCGFDCIPADLGTFFLQNEVRSRFGKPSPKIKFRVKGFKGGASGGTIASMVNMMEEASADPEVLRTMNHPYSLNPKAERSGPDGAEPTRPAYDDDFDQWTAPFVMGTIDTKVVRRSNAMLGYAYGKDFRYDEAMLSGKGPAGFAKAAGTAAFSMAAMGAMAIGPLRRLIAPRLPAPGEGPTPEDRKAGYFDIRFLAESPNDPSVKVGAQVTGDRDPGYGSTSKMLAESAVCLALDELTGPVGMLTPASAMGEALLIRLQQHAGLTFSIDG